MSNREPGAVPRRLEEAKRAAEALDPAEVAAELQAARERREEAPEHAPPAPPPRPRSTSTLTSGGLVRVGICFDPERWEAVQELAAERGVSAAALVREAVEAHLFGTD